MIKRKAFTLIEIIISIGIMMIMATSIVLSTGSAKQTAKFEAERIAAVLNRLIETADRTHGAFWFIPEDNVLYVVYNEANREELNFKVSSGCSFSILPISVKGLGYNTTGNPKDGNYAEIHTASTPSVKVELSKDKNNEAKFTIVVNGTDKSVHYVHVLAK